MSTDRDSTPNSRPNSTSFGLATLFSLLTIVAVGLAVWLEVSKSEVTAYLQVSRSTTSAGLLGAGSDRASEQAYNSFRQTQAELLRCEPVLARALSDPLISSLSLLSGKSDPVHWLHRHLKIDFPGDSEVMRIRLSSHDPAQAAQVVNAVVDTYFKHFVENEIQSRERREYQLRQRITEMSESLVSDKKNLLAIRINLGDGALGLAELDVKEAQIRVRQESVAELLRELQQMSLLKDEPLRVQRLDEATATP